MFICFILLGVKNAKPYQKCKTALPPRSFITFALLPSGNTILRLAHCGLHPTAHPVNALAYRLLLLHLSSNPAGQSMSNDGLPPHTVLTR